MAFQKTAHHFAAYREVDVLRQIARARGHFQRIELGDYHADHIAGQVEHRAALVAVLSILPNE